MTVPKIVIIFLTFFQLISCSENEGSPAAIAQGGSPILGSRGISKIGNVKYWSDKRVYSTQGNLPVRKAPGNHFPVITYIRNNLWYPAIEVDENWVGITLNNGKLGFIPKKKTTDKWLKVLKKERKIVLMKGAKEIKSFSIGLGFNPVGDKMKYGDGCTADGRFYICEKLRNPRPKKRYGARSLRLSYPEAEDARRGLQFGLINRSQYKSIIQSIYFGKMPLQNTKLGGSLRIHGGGSNNDWTLGCMALADDDIVQLYNEIPEKNLMVEIYRNNDQFLKMEHPLYVNDLILQGAKKFLKEKSKYTKEAMGEIRLKYPMGDINKKMGVCTDLVIRALRHANIDLQALLHEDILMNPKRYKNINRPNTNIDHRRVKNLKIWFDAYTIRLNDIPSGESGSQWQPGDIVFLDTNVRNGTPYDHIGIVSDQKSKGRFLVINLWTVGYKTNEMDLLDGKYPKIVGHYRFRHLYDYTVPIQ